MTSTRYTRTHRNEAIELEPIEQYVIPIFQYLPAQKRPAEAPVSCVVRIAMAKSGVQLIRRPRVEVEQRERDNAAAPACCEGRNLFAGRCQHAGAPGAGIPGGRDVLGDGRGSHARVGGADRFSRAFRRWTRMSPGEYRKSVRDDG